MTLLILGLILLVTPLAPLGLLILAYCAIKMLLVGGIIATAAIKERNDNR